MHKSISNLISIKSEVENLNDKLKIIAVTKTFSMDHILPLIEFGHNHFGENKVQEATSKWTEIKIKRPNIQLHMIGKLQTNKIKHAVKLFDYIHSVENLKIAKKIYDEQNKIKKRVKIFLQVNIGEEPQKAGLKIQDIDEVVNYCKNLNLDILGFMCIPPEGTDPTIHFKKMKELNFKYNFNELSMGMSSDYLLASKYNSTFLRIGSKIFGSRI